MQANTDEMKEKQKAEQEVLFCISDVFFNFKL